MRDVQTFIFERGSFYWIRLSMENLAYPKFWNVFNIYVYHKPKVIISINTKIIKNFWQIYWQMAKFVLKLISIMLEYDLNMKLLPGGFNLNFIYIKLNLK